MVNTRRDFLAKSIAAIVVSLPYLKGCVPKQAELKVETEVPNPIQWDEFIETLAALAQEQFSPDWDQDSYVEEVMALMSLLELEEEEFAELYDGYVDTLSSFPEITSVHEGGSFEVVTLEFEASSEIGLHNHPDMTGVILCLSGEVEVESYNLVSEEDAQGTVLIEQIEKITLRPGMFTTLTADRGNIHSLRANQYTALLDVFTPPYDEERLQHYKNYERSQESVEGNIFEAWVY